MTDMSSLLLNQEKRRYEFYPIKQLLKKEIIRPKWQRNVYENRVIKFTNIIESLDFIFYNPLIFCKYPNKPELYLIDGQHRFYGLKKINEKALNILTENSITIPLCIIECDNENEMKKHYNKINDQFSVTNFQEEEEKTLTEEEIKEQEEDNRRKKIAEEVSKKLYNKYKPYFSDSVRCQRPKMNQNELEKQIVYYLEQKSNISQEYLYSRICLYNEELIKSQNLPVTYFSKSIKKKIYNYGKKNKDIMCYLGGYKKYSWLKKIKLKPLHISKSIRDNCYINYESDMCGKCWCCELEPITKKNYHCGHIIPDNLGGRVTEYNLRPICANCNTSMGNIPMFEYMITKNYNKIKANKLKAHYQQNTNLYQYI